MIKLVVSGSVEEKVLSLQQRKRELLKNVFSESDAIHAKIGLADMRELLSRESDGKFLATG